MTIRSLPTFDESDESALLALINRGPSEETWQRYHALVASRRAETLTGNEQQELRELTDTIELVNSQRMATLSRLAVVRGISLDEVMDQLGIRDPGHLDS